MPMPFLGAPVSVHLRLCSLLDKCLSLLRLGCPLPRHSGKTTRRSQTSLWGIYQPQEPPLEREERALVRWDFRTCQVTKNKGVFFEEVCWHRVRQESRCKKKMEAKSYWDNILVNFDSGNLFIGKILFFCAYFSLRKLNKFLAETPSRVNICQRQCYFFVVFLPFLAIFEHFWAFFVCAEAREGRCRKTDIVRKLQ